MKKIILVLLGIYFFTRLYNLTLLPIFTDESIYIYWAKIIATTHNQLFISLTDGKPPLLVWSIAFLLSFFPNNLYLIAGRLPSVLAGAVSLVGIYKLSNRLVKSKLAATLSGVLYIFSPFFLLYDKMALFDSMLAAALIWTVYLAYDYPIFSGLALGLAFWSKPTAILFIPVILFIAVVQKRIKWGIVAVIIGEAINNLMRLSHVYYLMESKNQQFQQPLAKLLADPFALFPGNLGALVNWDIAYITVPLFILGILALFFLVIKDWKKGLVFLGCWAGPLVVFAMVGREIFPRYILFTTPFILVPIGFLVNKFRHLLIIMPLLFIPALQFDYALLTNPVNAPMPDTDYHQYVSEHPSGYGLEPVFNFLHEETKHGPTVLITQGTFGLYPYAFTLEFWGDKNLNIVPRWPLSSIDKEMQALKVQGKVYLLLKEFAKPPSDWPMTTVLISPKPPGGEKYPLILSELK